MDKSRIYKRPPDVDEALSSMLWTPYDRTAATSSSSTDSLSDDEREREKRKLSRHSSPLPSSLNWWNSHVASVVHPASLRYSFPFYGSYLPPLPHAANSVGGGSGGGGNTHGPHLSSSGSHNSDYATLTAEAAAAALAPPSLAHSFTDDFYHYQHQQTLRPSSDENMNKKKKKKPALEISATDNCQSTHNKGDERLIDTTHLAASAMTLPMQLSHQRNQNSSNNNNNNNNNVRTLSASIWQRHKTGNVAETLQRNAAKVTQPTEAAKTFDAQHSAPQQQRQHQPRVPTQQISHILYSNENALASRDSPPLTDPIERERTKGEEVLGFFRPATCRESESSARHFLLAKTNMNGADACKNTKHNNRITNDSSCSGRDVSFERCDKIIVSCCAGSDPHPHHHPQMPSSSSLSSSQQQQQNAQHVQTHLNPVSLTTNHSDTPLAGRRGVTSSVAVDQPHSDATLVGVNFASVECHDESKNSLGRSGEIAASANLIITSAMTKEAHIASDLAALREKKRRDRRDRRLARTRALSGTAAAEITADTPRPPPYSSLPPQPSSAPASSIIPSIISTVPVDDTVRYTFSLPLVRRSTSDRSGKDCCGQWFNGPPLRFLVALVALGGVACTLGGATLGSIALAGSPTSHLTAGLLMTGVGIVLVTISGVAWRMTTSDAHQCTGRCGRRQCSRGNSSFGLLYPEFQHRPPPPSYQASMQEHRLRVMMLDRERQTSNTRASPPPTYRSNAGTLLRPPIQFSQRQQQQQNASSSSSVVQVESESILLSDNASRVSATLEFVHSNPSQTITTIASINRPDSDIDPADATSLVRINETTRMTAMPQPQHQRHDDIDDEEEEEEEEMGGCRINRSFASSSSSSNSSSSRCTTFSDRHNTLCNNKTTLDHHNNHHHHHHHHHSSSNRHYKVTATPQQQQHEQHAKVIDDKVCKNVNIGNMMELNKALMPSPHVPRCNVSFLDRDTCEMGVR